MAFTHKNGTNLSDFNMNQYNNLLSSILITTILFITPEHVRAQEKSKDINTLEQVFIAESDFIKAYQFEETPEDIQKFIRYGFSEDKIANYGESYNRTSLINPKFPLLQHQFTTFTSKISSSLIKKGGFFLSSHIIIYDRENGNGCIYNVNNGFEFYDLFQELIRQKEVFISNGTIIKDCTFIRPE
ncbi:hypothetical protein SAMN05421647_10443 [Marinobacterium stanieri]|uniref:Uncharacterized protein n=2 Tax=Marinobacterium stanieri TaxID=49186 RepID=A0A1N6S5S2_9GAMM|nr:hypothetical protein SAMN05421647_10443 [Marinobacterium stanieri]